MVLRLAVIGREHAGMRFGWANSCRGFLVIGATSVSVVPQFLEAAAVGDVNVIARLLPACWLRSSHDWDTYRFFTATVMPSVMLGCWIRRRFSYRMEYDGPRKNPV